MRRAGTAPRPRRPACRSASPRRATRHATSRQTAHRATLPRSAGRGRARQAGFSCDQAFLQKRALLARGIIIQRAKDLVAESFVEATGLECIEPDRVATAIHGVPLGSCQQFAPEAFSTPGIVDPQLVDKEPIPVKSTRETTGQTIRVVAQQQGKALLRQWHCPAVELIDLSAQRGAYVA